MLLFNTLIAQKNKPDKEMKKAMMHDTLDGKLDFSRFLVEAHGFIPVPYIITEPALGGFGGMLIPLFIKPKKSVDGAGYVPPDITGGIGLYTVNDTWAVGGFRMGSFPKASMKYRIGLGYGNINCSFYRDIPQKGETEFAFNIRTLPVILSLSKKISKQEVYLGLQYQYMRTKLKPRFSDPLPGFINDKEIDNRTAALGVFMDWDKRNSIFTPDKGARLNILYNVNDQWTGSDFNYQQLNGTLNWFVPVKPNWISGLRAEVQQVFNDPPFYLLPYINMRGVPTARFQGTTTALVETEQRIDVNLRWSVVAFGGLAKAMEENQSFGEARTIYNIGTGFRYLLAVLFKLRAGIDIAKGTDSFGYYIVFGHNWNR
jgi:hypothetical protein